MLVYRRVPEGNVCFEEEKIFGIFYATHSNSTKKNIAVQVRLPCEVRQLRGAGEYSMQSCVFSGPGLKRLHQWLLWSDDTHYPGRSFEAKKSDLDSENM